MRPSFLYCLLLVSSKLLLQILRVQSSGRHQHHNCYKQLQFYSMQARFFLHDL